MHNDSVLAQPEHQQ